MRRLHPPVWREVPQLRRPAAGETMGLRMRARFYMAAALGLLMSAGCVVSVDYGNTSFSCADGECPDGYSCVEAVCVSDEIAAAVDAAPPQVDADQTPDAGEPDSTPLATCEELFGQAPGYQLCSEDELSCSFNVALAGETCTAACLLLESTCLAAFDNDAADLCAPIEATGDTCDTPRSTEICVCARP